MAEQASAQTFQSGNKIDSVAVLACGYRQIQSPKSGLRFPTFLVYLPNQQTAVWRSKRDFLLLGRLAVSPRPLFPKSALKKLAEKAPWRLPSFDDSSPLCLGSKTNQYHVSMKKNIQQLNQFIHSIQKLASGENHHVEEAWDLFCRPGDTEGLLPLDSLAKKVKSTAETTTTYTITSQQESCRLGQYFCSTENAQKIVSIVLEMIQPLIEIEHSMITFVEPSCGKGDIVTALIDGLETRNIPSSRVFIQGYDIDPNAIRTCQNLQLPSKYQVSWTCSNFLESQCINKKMTVKPLVVCLGGPPYTTGAGSSVEIQRDLPSLFIEHCFNEWGASLVCFLLPSRYKNWDNTITLPSELHRETFALQSSTFFFQGTFPVTQPSIIQCLSFKKSDVPRDSSLQEIVE